MAFGSKFDRESAEGGGEGSVSTASIWNFQAGSTIVRFLDDLEDWTEYWEHYDRGAGKNGAFFPCTGDRASCPGCVNGMDSSHKWLVNAYVIDCDAEKGGKGYTNLYKFPKSLMAKVMRHFDRIGTLKDHDFEIIRTGTGKDTEYDMERGEKTDFDFDTRAPHMLDHEETLQAVYDAYTGKRVAEKVTSAAAPKASEPVTTVGSNAKMTEEQAKAAEAGDPPSEPSAAEAPAAQTEGDESEFTEDDLRKMEKDDLEALIKRAGLDKPDHLDSANDMVDWLIETLGED